MENSSSAAARSAYALRFALVVLVCLAFGLVLGYSAMPAVSWLGKRIAIAETSRSAVVSRSGRSVQADNLRALSSVRTGTHQGEHWESKAPWDYCGNPQCRLCYPVAGPLSRRETPLTSDTGLPDMPQGYCKRHPQSRDCKPIVVPSPKPLPKATDPPVVASAGLGAVSRETLAWALVCVFFVAWLVSGLELSRSKQSLRVADRLLGRREIEASEVRQIVQSWLDKQGHDRCWYYPEIFTELARALNLRGVKPPQLPSLAEFKAGCERYQREQYSAQSAIYAVPWGTNSDERNAEYESAGTYCTGLPAVGKKCHICGKLHRIDLNIGFEKAAPDQVALILPANSDERGTDKT